MHSTIIPEISPVQNTLFINKHEHSGLVTHHSTSFHWHVTTATYTYNMQYTNPIDCLTMLCNNESEYLLFIIFAEYSYLSIAKGALIRSDYATASSPTHASEVCSGPGNIYSALGPVLSNSERR